MKIVAKGAVRVMTDSDRAGCVNIVISCARDEARVIFDKGDPMRGHEAVKASFSPIEIELREVAAETVHFKQPIYITLDTDEPTKSLT